MLIFSFVTLRGSLISCYWTCEIFYWIGVKDEVKINDDWMLNVLEISLLYTTI